MEDDSSTCFFHCFLNAPDGDIRRASGKRFSRRGTRSGALSATRGRPGSTRPAAAPTPRSNPRHPQVAQSRPPARGVMKPSREEVHGNNSTSGKLSPEGRTRGGTEREPVGRFRGDRGAHAHGQRVWTQRHTRGPPRSPPGPISDDLHQNW